MSSSIRSHEPDRMVYRTLRVRVRDIVFVKGLLEAHEGIGQVTAEPRAEGTAVRDAVHGGTVILSAPSSREAELDELIETLRSELQLLL